MGQLEGWEITIAYRVSEMWDALRHQAVIAET